METPGVINNDNQQKKNNKPKRTLSSSQKRIIVVMIGVLLIISSYVGVYKWGNSKGYSAGYSNGKKDAAKTVKPLTGMLNDIANPFRAVSGDVEAVTRDSITVNSVKGQKVTITLNDKTKVSEKAAMRTIGDLQVGKKVTVFTQGEGDAKTASRIVIRAK